MWPDDTPALRGKGIQAQLIAFILQQFSHSGDVHG
jgi:predicted GNAT family acetyltransferase